jgi:hypothetical protein
MPKLSKMQKMIKMLMKQSRKDFVESKPLVEWHELELKYAMETMKSDLEKIFYLLLRQEYYKNGDYVVIPNEKVCVKNICDFDKGSECEYEVDFAIYSGSKTRPRRVAIECDGLRSHGRKNSNKDRLKGINLQASGWIVIRFDSREIHQEVDRYLNSKKTFEKPVFLELIERVIFDLQDSVVEGINQTEVRDLLTGYRSFTLECPSCGWWRYYRHTEKKFVCDKCGLDLKGLAMPVLERLLSI